MWCFLTAKMIQHDANMRGFVGFFSSHQGQFVDDLRISTVDVRRSMKFLETCVTFWATP